MRFRILVPLAFLLILCTTGLQAQVTLYSENFDACFLPPGWEVNITGNQNPVWYVGDAVLNNDDNGQSMNGSCFLFIDDDATGDQTPAYVIDFVSAPFDASQHPTVELSVDVHYRDWGSANEYFAILVTDGVTETEITRFDKSNATGDTLSEYVTLKADLALLTKSPNARLIFRYDDAGGFDWWAGFDNIKVTGLGDGTNVIAESFNTCGKPAGWETEVLTGDADWSFGKATNPKAGNGTSINGSCFAYFDDDLLGDSALYSTARLYTPWFDGTQFGKFSLDFDLILRYYSEIVTIYVQNGNGDEVAVNLWNTDIGGPLFSNAVHQSLDLSPYRAAQMRVGFEYADGNQWAWWTGIDNVKITGNGAANDLCINALELLTGADCKEGNTRTAILDGPPASCVDKNIAGLWYRWQADFTGTAKLSSSAAFNDVVNVYTGTCGGLTEIACNNRDEHGFTGETTYFTATAGTQYLIRISGVDGGFGKSRGDFCVKINQATSVPVAPLNDDCVNALSLTVDGPCQSGNNSNAVMSATLPSLNKLARADVWYSFTAPALTPDQVIAVESNAAFSDIITAYQGGCANLTEIAGNHHGGTLELNTLTAGQTYFVQIAGNFATIEGNLCPQILKKAVGAPANDNCISAIPVSLGGGQCTASTNENATFSGNIPPCVVDVDRDVWFKFTASASGSVRINTGATFEHVLAVWSGDCNTLTPVFCMDNPLRCDGFVLVGNLSAGQTYYVQIASRSTTTGPVSGAICLKIIDGAAPAEFDALNLQVQEQCNGLSTATLVVNTSGGVPPYNYQGNPNGQILQSGDTYIVVVADANGCEKSIVGVIDDCSASGCTVASSVTATNPSCYGLNDGTLAVNVAGGTPPYTFHWFNGAEGQLLPDLAPGDYTVTVTDALGCEQIATQTIVYPAQILAVPTSIQQPLQGESNGAIYVDISGDGPFTYTWKRNGADISSTEDLVNAPEGNYELFITNSNGCSAVFNFTLTEVVGSNTPVESIFAEIFPNPAKDKAVLTVSVPKPTALFLSLSNSEGQVLHAWTVENVSEQNIPFEVKDLPGGVYQLRILAGKEMLVRKVVVAR